VEAGPGPPPVEQDTSSGTAENIVFNSLVFPRKWCSACLRLSTGWLYYPGHVLRIRIGFNADPEPAF
jgi:hypothetical protein